MSICIPLTCDRTWICRFTESRENVRYSYIHIFCMFIRETVIVIVSCEPPSILKLQHTIIIKLIFVGTYMNMQCNKWIICLAKLNASLDSSTMNVADQFIYILNVHFWRYLLVIFICANLDFRLAVRAIYDYELTRKNNLTVYSTPQSQHTIITTNEKYPRSKKIYTLHSV